MIKEVLCCAGRGAELMMWWVSSLSSINNPQHPSSKSSLCLRSLAPTPSLGQGSAFSQTWLFFWGKRNPHGTMTNGSRAEELPESCLASGQERTFCVKIHLMWMILFTAQISACSSLPYPEILGELTLKNWKSDPLLHAELNSAGFFFFWKFIPLGTLPFTPKHSLPRAGCLQCLSHQWHTVSWQKMCKMRLDSETSSPTAVKIPLEMSHKSRVRR